MWPETGCGDKLSGGGEMQGNFIAKLFQRSPVSWSESTILLLVGSFPLQEMPLSLCGIRERASASTHALYTAVHVANSSVESSSQRHAPVLSAVSSLCN